MVKGRSESDCQRDKREEAEELQRRLTLRTRTRGRQRIRRIVTAESLCNDLFV